jgi:poly(A) polymerase
MPLSPVTRLADADWLKAEAPRTVIETLAAAGYTARAVGGCVRDAVLQRPIGDIDLATDARPETVRACLEAAGLKVVPTGMAHGTVTAVVKGRPVEVTTLRTDVETFGRHARVAFTDDWQADARRRDFTMNALYADLDGSIYDPVGGYGDLKAGVVRFIGDARARITEDALRILRYFRFLAWFGQGHADTEAMQACAALRANLRILSAERVCAELLKMLSADDPIPALRAMAAVGVTDELFEKPLSVERLARLAALETRYAEADSLRRLAGWLDAGSAYARHVGQALRLSNAQQERLIGLANPLPALPGPMSEHEVRRLLYFWGRQRLVDVALLSMADGAAQDLPLARMGVLPVPRLPVQGRDVLALGVPAGPKVGTVLTAFEEWWVRQDFPVDRGLIMQKLKGLAEGL